MPQNRKINKTAQMDGIRSQLIFAGIFVASAAVVFFIFNLLTDGKFLDPMNLRVILSNMVYPTFMSWGMCFLFACGYYDMSWGGVVVLGSFATVAFGNMYGLPAAIIAGVSVGAVLVFINICIFTFTKVPSWIASISLAMVYEAIAMFLLLGKKTGPHVETQIRSELRLLGQLPWSLVVLAAGFIIIYFVYNRTMVGFNIRAIGGNAAVARSLGVNVGKTLLWVGLICGLIIGVSAFLQQSYASFTTVKTGLSSIFLIFQPLAIAHLAEILKKKINIIIAVPICSFLMLAAFNLLTLLRFPSGTMQEALLSLFLITFAIIGQRGVKGVVK